MAHVPAQGPVRQQTSAEPCYLILMPCYMVLQFLPIAILGLRGTGRSLGERASSPVPKMIFLDGSFDQDFADGYLSCWVNTMFLPVLATVLSPGASSNLFFHRVLLATSSSPVRQTCIHKYNVIIQHLRQQHLRDQIVFDFTTTDARTCFDGFDSF